MSHRGDTVIPPSRTRIATWARREANEVNEVVRRVADAFTLFGERTIAAPWIEAVYMRSAGVPPAVSGRPGR